MNTSTYSDDKTAKTNSLCALQRAENLYLLNSKNVIELCVGPSLSVLENTYRRFNINVTGNDIDPRWQKYYPQGKWVIGDARSIDLSKFDTVVIAPPLSRNCSGRREDSLSLDEVFPKYEDFLHLKNRVLVFVLPARTLSIKNDRKQFYKFLSKINGKYEVVPLYNKVVKYIDLYCY